MRLFRVRLARHQRINDAGQRRADDGREPEEPELLNRPAADEQRRTRAARGVDRKIRDRDADEMDEREPEADSDGREALRGALVRRAEDDQQEEKVSTASETKQTICE